MFVLFRFFFLGSPKISMASFMIKLLRSYLSLHDLQFEWTENDWSDLLNRFFFYLSKIHVKDYFIINEIIHHDRNY